MLSEKEVQLFQKQFRKITTTRNAHLYFEDDYLVLDLSLGIGDGHESVFYFNHYDITDTQTFVKALWNKVRNYDPIDEVIFTFDWRRKELGDEEAKKRLRSDLQNADIVEEALSHIAIAAEKIHLALKAFSDTLDESLEKSHKTHN